MNTKVLIFTTLTLVILLITFLSRNSLTNIFDVDERYLEDVPSYKGSESLKTLKNNAPEEAQLKSTLSQNIEVNSKRNEENADELPENLSIYHLNDLKKMKNIIKEYSEPIESKKLSWNKLNSRLFQNYSDKRFRSVKKIGGNFTAKINLTILKSEVYSNINIAIKELNINCLNSFQRKLVESPWYYISNNGSLLLKFSCAMDFQNNKIIERDKHRLDCLFNIFFLENPNHIASELYCKLDRLKYTLISQDILGSRNL